MAPQFSLVYQNDSKCTKAIPSWQNLTKLSQHLGCLNLDFLVSSKRALCGPCQLHAFRSTELGESSPGAQNVVSIPYRSHWNYEVQKSTTNFQKWKEIHVYSHCTYVQKIIKFWWYPTSSKQIKTESLDIIKFFPTDFELSVRFLGSSSPIWCVWEANWSWSFCPSHLPR